MIYPNIIYHPDSGTTVFIDTLQQIGNSATADVVTYQSSLDGSLKTFNSGIGPRSLPLQGKISTDNVDTLRRQLQYLRGKQIYLMLGAQNTATVARIRSFDLPVAVGTYSPLTLDVECESETEGQFWEADDYNYGSSVDSPSNDSTMDQKIVVSNQWTGALKQLIQNDVELPGGDYMMFARMRDSNQVTNDASLAVVNATDSTYPGPGTPHTLTSAYKIYTCDFTIDSNDQGDTIRFFAQKETTTANNIDIDFFGFVRL